MRLFAVLLLLLSIKVSAQVYPLGRAETNNMFYVAVTGNEQEFLLSDLFLDSSATFCSFDIYNNNTLVRHVTIVQNNGIMTGLRMDTIVRQGETFFAKPNTNPQFINNASYTRIILLRSMTKSDVFVPYPKNREAQYNYYFSDKANMPITDYKCKITIKTRSESKTYFIDINGEKMSIRLTDHNAKYQKDANNWFDFSQGTGYFQSKMLYLGAEGDIFFFASGQKKIVTAEVKLWPKQE